MKTKFVDHGENVLYYYYQQHFLEKNTKAMRSQHVSQLNRGGLIEFQRVLEELFDATRPIFAASFSVPCPFCRHRWKMRNGFFVLVATGQIE